MDPAIHYMISANQITAANTFLNWFKFVLYLSYVPTFALLSETIGKAGPDVMAFMMVFGIILWGFSQAHGMVFHAKLYDYRSLDNSVYALVRSLLGDFDFESLRHADKTMGPIFFLIFVMCAVFVVLNMLIAIISDAYSVCRENMLKKEKVNLAAEIHEFTRDWVESLPFIGPKIKQARLLAQKTAEHAASATLERAMTMSSGIAQNASEGRKILKRMVSGNSGESYDTTGKAGITMHIVEENEEIKEGYGKNCNDDKPSKDVHVTSKARVYPSAFDEGAVKTQAHTNDSLKEDKTFDSRSRSEEINAVVAPENSRQVPLSWNNKEGDTECIMALQMLRLACLRSSNPIQSANMACKELERLAIEFRSRQTQGQSMLEQLQNCSPLRTILLEPIVHPNRSKMENGTSS